MIFREDFNVGQSGVTIQKSSTSSCRSVQPRTLTILSTIYVEKINTKQTKITQYSWNELYDINEKIIEKNTLLWHCNV